MTQRTVPDLMPLSFARKIATMPKEYPAEVRERAGAMVLERRSVYLSTYAACKALAPKLDVGTEALRRWVIPAQIDVGARKPDHC